MPPTNIAEMPSNASNFIATLNAVIKKCRDILRLEGITGMDSMKHLTLYTLLRRLDTSECKKLKIPVKFSWEKFMDVKDDHQRCFDLLYSKSGATEDLISCLDNLFGTKNFNFKLNNPTHHVEILNEFKKLDFSNLDGKIDILGTIYEIHLGSGSNQSAMRDLGQFFTERDVCKYMTALCNPKVLPDGRAESVLDPTMGTGGFLSSYIQHLGSSIDWSKMHNDIAGYDIDEFVMSIGKINLYLQTGQLFERIKHRDTLSHDIGTYTQRLKFKNILANMPFGVKGLTHAGCCLRVRNLKIQSTKSEPLFLQLMMASLDDGGRCAVVVPDGVLVNTSKGHNETRKYLLEHFELKRVIKMKGQFFSNTSIKPSILFFENTGKPTSVTEFWEVEKNSSSVISEKLIVSVPREKIDTNSYSLDMRRYAEVVVPEKASAFPMVKLGDVCKVSFGERITQKKNTGTIYPVYGSGGDTFRTDNHNRNGKTCKIGRFALSESNMVMFVNGPYWLMDSGFTVESKNTELMLTEYLWYSLLMDKKRLATISTGSCQKNIDMEEFYKLQYSCPPLETQQQIVAELDSIYENAHKATQMAISIKTQMASVMKSVGMRGYERKKIGDVCDLLSGKGGNYQSDGDIYPYYDSNGITGMRKEHCFDGEYIITARKMSIGSVHYATGKFWSSDNTINICVKDTSTLISRFFYYWLLNNNKVLKDLSSGVKPGIRKSDVAEILIPLPPLETQQQILAILNEMEGERKSLEQMASKAEERAKFILDGYLNSA